jgi:hypothetical protein
MIDDWKEIHRGFQGHKKKKPQHQQQQQQRRITITQKDGTRSTLYWATTKYGRDWLMLAMLSCADGYDSERHFGGRRTSSNSSWRMMVLSVFIGSNPPPPLAGRQAPQE